MIKRHWEGFVLTEYEGFWPRLHAEPRREEGKLSQTPEKTQKTTKIGQKL
jgi:hypothetical protein